MNDTCFCFHRDAFIITLMATKKQKWLVVSEECDVIDVSMIFKFFDN